MPEEIEEKKELLKREEIRTMQKDIARLREIEAQKERERVAALKLEEIKKEKPPPPPKIEKPKVPSKALIPKPLPKKPSPFKKVLVRGVILVVLLLIFGFFYWFLGVKKPPEEVILPAEEEIIPPEEKEEEVVEAPEIVIPPSLISVNATETLEITTLKELPLFLSQLLEKKFETGWFTLILIKDVKENKILGLKKFFEAFKVKTPQGFLDKLNNDFTLFIYTNKGVNSFGFIIKIKEKEGLTGLATSWGSMLEKDTENLFPVLSKEGPAPIPFFWSIFKDYFIWTSSGESILKIINELTE